MTHITTKTTSNQPGVLYVADDQPPVVIACGVDRISFFTSYEMVSTSQQVAEAERAVADLGDAGMDVQFLHAPPRAPSDVVFQIRGDLRGLSARFGARALAALGLDDVVTAFGLVAEELAPSKDRTDRVNYAELFVDLQMFPSLTTDLKKLFRGRFRKIIAVEDRSGSVLAFMFGTSRSPVQGKVYLKSGTGIGGQRGKLLEPIYQQCESFSPGEPVTRIEFVLRDLRRCNIPVDPQAFASSLSSTWPKLCDKFLHLHVPGIGRARGWPRVRWWKAIVAAAWPKQGQPLSADVAEHKPDVDHLLRGAAGQLAAIAAASYGADKQAAKDKLLGKLPPLLASLFTKVADRDDLSEVVENGRVVSVEGQA